MSKLFKTIILVLVVVCSINVKAITPKVQYIDNVYSNRIVNGKSINGKFGYIYINSEIAFCIDPMIIIGNEYQTYGDIFDNYYTKEQQRKIKLMIHYGVESHRGHAEYYMAVQELIWRLNNEGDFYFTKTPSLDGERINIEAYKQEILENVERHDIYPSFNKITVRPKLNETIILEDKNYVLEGYNPIEQGNIIYQENNRIEYSANSLQPITLKFLKVTESGKSSNIYIGNGQTLITSNIIDKQEMTINIIPRLEEYYFNINFKENDDYINGKVKFKIYNYNTSNYVQNGQIFESNDQGIYQSDFKLNYGNYGIVYVDIPKNYIQSKISNDFILDENTKVDDNLRYNFTSYLESPYGILKINRGAEKIDKSIYMLNNIIYDIYSSKDTYDNNFNLIYKKDELVKTISTTNGYVETTLPIGEYYIVERNNDYGIEKIDNQYISFKYIDSTIEYYIIEKNFITPLYKLNLIINTYKENIDKTFSKFEYFKYELVAQTDIYYLNELVYKKNQIILKLKSDVYGNINKNINIVPGKYILIEKNSSNNYYKQENIELNYTKEETKTYDIYKKLKRGNLLIKINSNIINKPNTITFFYDNNLKYKIDNELLINEIKIGKYQLFYDKEYEVDIKDSVTTILEINLLEQKNDDVKNSGNKNNSNDKKSENKDNNDKNNENVNIDNPKDFNQNINNSEKNNFENKIDEIINNQVISDDKLNKLPKTYNYLKQYCLLYEMFLIAGLIIKLYAKKNK